MLSATRASALPPRGKIGQGSRVARSGVRPVLAPVRRAPLASPPRAGGDGDFDDVLAKYADKWDKAENKGAIVGGFAAAAAALFVGEWVAHLPVLSFLVGFPVQLVGFFMIPPLAVRYLVEKKDLEKDVEEQVGKVVGAVFKK